MSIELGELTQREKRLRAIDTKVLWLRMKRKAAILRAFKEVGE